MTRALPKRRILRVFFIIPAIISKRGHEKNPNKANKEREQTVQKNKRNKLYKTQRFPNLFIFLRKSHTKYIYNLFRYIRDTNVKYR
jgi:hypothetical protein